MSSSYRYQNFATAGTSPLVNTTAVQIAAAPTIPISGGVNPTILGGATSQKMQIFLTDLDLSNGGTTGTVVQLLDGSTIIWAYYLPSNAVAAPSHFNFQSPLHTSPGNALSIVAVTTGSSVQWNASWFVDNLN